MSEDLKNSLNAPPESVVPVAPVVVEVPKTKEQWDKLKTENPDRWGSLTQERMDATIRQNREQAEKLEKERQEKLNLQAELEKYRSKEAPVVPEVIQEPYGEGKYPETEEQWNDLFLERPAFATDLRNDYLNKRRTVESDVEQTRANSRKIVQAEHQDMYLAETDETGKPKVDEKGKLVLKLDPTTKEPIFNPDSEKGKLWIEIFNENPQGWLSFKNSPSLMMAEMERRLRVNGSKLVSGQGNAPLDDQTGLAPRGVTPPKVTNVTFANDEERKWVEASVARGTFKSAEEWQRHTEIMKSGWSEQGRTPDFTKR